LFGGPAELAVDQYLGWLAGWLAGCLPAFWTNISVNVLMLHVFGRKKPDILYVI